MPLAYNSDRGFVLRDEEAGAAVISIRGTDDLADWVGNAAQNWKEIAGHLSRSIDRIIEPLQLAILPRKLTLWFTGHSRGGAIAQHLSRLYKGSPCHCITFGTPRSCKENISVDGISYCLPWDPVPMLPVWSRGYRDPAIRQYVFADFVDDEDPISLWRSLWSACSVAAIYAWEWRHFRWGSGQVSEWALKRHAMRHYVSALAGMEDACV